MTSLSLILPHAADAYLTSDVQVFVDRPNGPPMEITLPKNQGAVIDASKGEGVFTLPTGEEVRYKLEPHQWCVLH